MGNSGPFYLAIIDKPKSEVWYKKQIKGWVFYLFIYFYFATNKLQKKVKKTNQIQVTISTYIRI